jgi:hypothetical protein
VLLFIGLGRTDRGDTLHCAGCGALIARADDICRVMDRPPRKTYENPHGLLCPILTLARAEGLELDAHTSTMNTWFEGYAWRPAACGGCGLFLGWAFEAVAGEAGPAEFCGLLEERLISRPAAPVED